MNLVNTKSGHTVACIKGDTVTINDDFLRQEMEEDGILIPPFMAAHFQGKRRIKLGEAQFPKAFREVYYSLCMDPTVFSWEKESR